MASDLSKPNPYVLGLFSALCAACLALVGNYFLTTVQLPEAFRQKDVDCQREAYLSFLAKVDRKNDPALSELLAIGGLAESVSTDSEIADLENRIKKITKSNDNYDLYWHLK